MWKGVITSSKIKYSVYEESTMNRIWSGDGKVGCYKTMSCLLELVLHSYVEWISFQAARTLGDIRTQPTLFCSVNFYIKLDFQT